MSESRKLAAILVADVVGYSRLAGADEDRILARLRALRSDLIDPIVAVHHGRIVKRTGDGSIIEFRSVVDAVRCAIEVQTGLIERNAGVAPERRIEYRVGIHLGDVVEEADGDLMGDGVNIAARLEGVAKPGGICLSEDAHRQVKGRLDLKVSDLGPVELKNIAEPIRVYALEVGQPAGTKPPLARTAAVKPESATPAPRASGWLSRWPALAAIALLLLAAAGGWTVLGGRLAKPAQAGHLSIVVLPFANLSGDPAQDYFADGITENLTTELSRIKDSFVIARNTAFTYKGKSIDAKEIGKELGVRYVLEGSVERDQNRVRVNAQLIDAETGAHLWADRFDEDVADLFKLQDQIVARLANTLGYELIKAEARRDERIAHPDAFDLTMRGRALQMRYEVTKENNDAARALYERALAIDPNDASALAGEADTYVLDHGLGWGNRDVDWDAKILYPLDRSIAIDPDDPRPYAAKSFYLTNGNHPVDGLRAADAGLAIYPNDAELHSARGLAENYLGHFEQGISEVGQAVRLSPRDPYIGFWHNATAEAELGLGRSDAAIEEANKAIDAGYRVFLSYTMLTVAYALNGNLEQAKTALAEAQRLNPKLTVQMMHDRYPDFPWMSEGLRKAGLPEE